ncbi:hypothetical protein CTAYLR_004988 [Chrysophaeum taylorii]|uniref:DOT1 domain-containing protein n=1 Tax=Chrysophaeum taylorii TaxID=2483200 RepID=A0AAD7UAM1_9STRA|nr:hypothetical protein CTAYLR_004988 [Chrysophaeum taylorii]
MFSSRTSTQIIAMCVLLARRKGRNLGMATGMAPPAADFLELVHREEDDDVCHGDAWDGSESSREIAGELSAWLREHAEWSLSDADRARFARTVGDERSSTFGHATVRGVAAILAEWRRRGGGDRFVDLGSGIGHVALLGAVLDNSTRFRGVELAASRFDVAQRALREFDAAYPDLRLADRVSFELSDMLEASLAIADVVWVSSLALNTDILARLKAKLRRELRPGAVVARVLLFVCYRRDDLRSLHLIADSDRRVVEPRSDASSRTVTVSIFLAEPLFCCGRRPALATRLTFGPCRSFLPPSRSSIRIPASHASWRQ